MASSNRGAALPPEPQRRFFNIIGPTGKEPLSCQLLSDTFTGFWLHFVGRTLPCTATKDCRLCMEGHGNYWGAYISAWRHKRKDRIVAAISEEAARQLKVLQDRHGSLRGIQVKLSRRYVSKNNSVVVVEMLSREEPETVFKDHPIIDSLHRLWGINERWMALKARGEQPPADVEDNLGVPLPPPKMEADETRPTAEQRERLRRVMGGLGEMPG